MQTVSADAKGWRKLTEIPADSSFGAGLVRFEI
jgi:hypothetical protein